MFHVPVVKNGVNGHLRARGKVAELALGYGGSTGALIAMGATDMGIPEEDLKPLVDAWREANPRIVQYWWAVHDAVLTAVKLRIPQTVGRVRIEMLYDSLFITLPSGRKLVYSKPRIEENRFGGESVTYMGYDAQKHWCRIESYGPKIVENITQAICRDLLADAMKRLRQGRIVAHIHDEVVLEAPMDLSPETVCKTMCRAPRWAEGLELRAEGFAASFYQK